MLFETFNKDQTKTVRIGASKRILLLNSLWTEFHFSELQCIYPAQSVKKLTEIFAIINACKLQDLESIACMNYLEGKTK